MQPLLGRFSGINKLANYRNRVEVHATKDIEGRPHILASVDRSGIAFPGGGIEHGGAVSSAKREMLEEAGYSIKKPKLVSKGQKYTMSQKWQDESLSKRGKQYRGVNNHIVHAELGSSDERLLNVEGDAMSGLKLIPVEQAHHMLRRQERMAEFNDKDDWSQRATASRIALERKYPHLRKHASVERDLLIEADKDPGIAGFVRPDSKAKRVPFTHKGEVVGFMTPRLDPDGYHRVGAVYVKPEHRGKGIASKNIAKYMQGKRSKVWIDDDNVATARAHAKAGYKKGKRAAKDAHWYIKEAAKRKKAVIIKGNPYYLEQGPDTEGYAAYYRDIENELRKAGYEDVVYDKGEPMTSPPPADLWVGHSRGASRLRFAPKGTKTLNITEYEDGINEYKAKLLTEMRKRGYSSINEFPVEDRPRPGREHYTLTQRGRDALQKQASAPRDYKREYRLFHSSPEAKRNRAKRNLWNRRLKGKVPAGHEIDHKRQLRDGGGNGRDNIRFLPISKNRAEHNRKSVVRDHMRKQANMNKYVQPSEKMEIDRAKVKSFIGDQRKDLGSIVGLGLGGLAGARLGGIIGSAVGGVGAGLLGRHIARSKVSDSDIDKFIKKNRLHSNKMTDLEIAAYGSTGVGGNREAFRQRFKKTSAYKKRKMTHVDPDKYNKSFRLGQTIGYGLGGASLGGLLGSMAGKGVPGVLVGTGLGTLGMGAIGYHTYRPKSDELVYKLTKRTHRDDVDYKLLADLKDVHPDILNADNGTFLSSEDIRKEASFVPFVQSDWIKMAGIAQKRDPAKWEQAKRDAKARMGGKHSARAMQLAVKLYKSRGGEYVGGRQSASKNKLSKWTKQKWQWSGKDRKGQGGTGVYLPKKSAEQLKATKAGRSKLRAAAAIKRDATKKGIQFSSHGLHVGKKRSEVS